jgi:hypothetical protein
MMGQPENELKAEEDSCYGNTLTKEIDSTDLVN